jgi:L-asparaginase II
MSAIMRDHTPGHVPLLVSTRGYAGQETIECVQHGSIVIANAAGDVIFALGDHQAAHFSRSTLKPIQALPFVEDGGMSHFGFGSHELALMCASHSGETMHVALVRRMVARIGATLDDLKCGLQIPQYFEATRQRIPEHVQATSLAHNCSGKHTGFLAYCRLHDHPLDSYLDPASPLQTRIRNAVQSLTKVSEPAIGRDGCNAPNIALPLASLAHLYAQLATADDSAPLGALRQAMVRHPDLVSGTERTDLVLTRLGQGDWVCKIGADGMQAIGIRSLGLGIVVRLASGSTRATFQTTVDVLHQTGLLPDPVMSPVASAFRPRIINASGNPCGRHLPLFRLPRLAV